MIHLAWVVALGAMVVSAAFGVIVTSWLHYYLNTRFIGVTRVWYCSAVFWEAILILWTILAWGIIMAFLWRHG